MFDAETRNSKWPNTSIVIWLSFDFWLITPNQILDIKKHNQQKSDNLLVFLFSRIFYFGLNCVKITIKFYLRNLGFWNFFQLIEFFIFLFKWPTAHSQLTSHSSLLIFSFFLFISFFYASKSSSSSSFLCRFVNSCKAEKIEIALLVIILDSEPCSDLISGSVLGCLGDSKSI